MNDHREKKLRIPINASKSESFAKLDQIGFFKASERPGVAFYALFEPEELGSDPVEASYTWIIDHHCFSGNARQLSDQLSPLDHVRKQSITNNDIKGSIRIRQRQEVSGLEVTSTF